MAHQSSGAITFRLEDGLAIISLDRPAKRNALTLEMFSELGDATEAAAADRDVRCVLVRAEGPSFCAGIDLAALAGLAGAGEDRFRGFVSVAQRPFRLLATMGVPVIAAVRGHALGAGFQLALACDLRVVTNDAVFGLLEARYGLIPDLGGLHHLVREIGPARAKELAWSARTFGADIANDLGLVNRLVGPDELEDAVRVLIGDVTAHPPVVVRAVKELARGAFGRSLEQELTLEAQAQQTVLASEDHAEAVAAFVERRSPRYIGR